MLTDSLVNKNLPLVTRLLLAIKTAKLPSRTMPDEAAIIRTEAKRRQTAGVGQASPPAIRTACAVSGKLREIQEKSQ